MSWRQLTLSLATRAMIRPRLAADLLRVGWRFRQRGWYRRPPFIPRPPAAYLRWRMYTAYGDEAITPPARDIERYARWVGRFGSYSRNTAWRSEE